MLWLGVERTVVERVELRRAAGEPTVVAHVRRVAAQRSRSGVCRRHCPRYDVDAGRRRWRSLDRGTVQVVVVAATPRVRCPDHGVVAAVPWAPHGDGHIYGFDDQVAWLAVRCSKSAVRNWCASRGGPLARSLPGSRSTPGPATTTSPGYAIDEMSDKQGHRYLTEVVDQDRRRLVWAALGVAEGKSAADLQGLAAGVAAVGLDESVVDALGLEPGERKCRS